MFLAILLLSSLRKGHDLRFKQIEFSSQKDALWRVWLKLTQWFWRFWRLFKLPVYQFIFALSLKSPLGKGCGPSFEQTWILYSSILCAKFSWNWPCGSGDEDENVKSIQQWWRGRTAEKFCSEKLTLAYRSGELKLQVMDAQSYKQDAWHADT